MSIITFDSLETSCLADGFVIVDYNEWVQLCDPVMWFQKSLRQYDPACPNEASNLKQAENEGRLWSVVEVDFEHEFDEETSEENDDGELPAKEQMVVNGRATFDCLYYVIARVPTPSCFSCRQIQVAL